MTERLVCGEIYDVMPHMAVRKGVYLGMREDRKMKNKHIIVTRRYHAEGIIIYRFNSFEFKEGVLRLGIKATQNMSKIEEEFVESLLSGKGL